MKFLFHMVPSILWEKETQLVKLIRWSISPNMVVSALIYIIIVLSPADTDEGDLVNVARDLWGADVVFEVWVEDQQEQHSYKACPTDGGCALVVVMAFLQILIDLIEVSWHFTLKLFNILSLQWAFQNWVVQDTLPCLHREKAAFVIW